MKRYKTVSLYKRFGNTRRRNTAFNNFFNKSRNLFLLVAVSWLILEVIRNRLPVPRFAQKYKYDLEITFISLGVVLLLYLIKKLLLKNKKINLKNYVESHIISFLNRNKLYEEETYTDGKGNKKAYLTDSAYFTYLIDFDKNRIYLRSVLTGKMDYDRKLKDLQESVSHLLGYDLWNFRATNDYFEYELLLEEHGRLYSRRKEEGYIFTDSKGNVKDFSSKGVIPISDFITWEYDKNPHGLVVGGTGSGKTVFLQYLIRSFMLHGSEMYIADPKRMDLYASMRDFVSKDRIGTTTGQIIKLMRLMNEAMENRYEEMANNPNYQSNNNYSDYGYSPIVMIFDEYAGFMSQCSKNEKEEVSSYMKNIVMKGRQSGVFIIIGIQRPDAKVISGDIRDQLGLRVALGKMSSEGERMAFGSLDVELKTPSEKGGGHIYLDGQGWLMPKLFSTPFMPNDIYDFQTDIKAITST